MAKITRLNGNYQAFARDSLAGERTLFGEETASNDLTDQHTAAYAQGWRGAVAPSGVPTVQDFNALGFAIDQGLAYLHQAGVPEWDLSQEYYAGSLCVHDGGLGPQMWMARGGAATGVEPGFDFGGLGHWIPVTRRRLCSLALSITEPGANEFTVGAAGDFATLEDAIRAMAWGMEPPLPDGTVVGVVPTVTITCESGYADASQHVIDGIDLSWVRIEHADDEMSVARSALTDQVAAERPWMAAVNGGRAPVVALNPYLDSSGAAGAQSLFVAEGAGSHVEWETSSAASDWSDTPSLVGAYRLGTCIISGTGSTLSIGGVGGFGAYYGGRIMLTRAIDLAGGVQVLYGSHVLAEAELTVGSELAIVYDSAVIANGISLDLGSLVMDGGRLVVAQDLTLGAESVVDGRSGVQISGGLIFASATSGLDILGESSVLVAGNVSGSVATRAVTVRDSALVVGGSFAVADATTHDLWCYAGRVSISGAVTAGVQFVCQDGGVLSLGDQIVTEGLAVLAGGRVTVDGNAFIGTSGSTGGSPLVVSGGEMFLGGTLTVYAGADGAADNVRVYDDGKLTVLGNVLLGNGAGASAPRHRIFVHNGGTAVFRGTVLANSSASHHIHCLRGDIRFGDTVTASTGNQYGLYCDGGSIAGATIESGTSRPSQQLAVVNGGHIMRSGGGGQYVGYPGYTISTAGYINQ